MRPSVCHRWDKFWFLTFCLALPICVPHPVNANNIDWWPNVIRIFNNHVFDKESRSSRQAEGDKGIALVDQPSCSLKLSGVRGGPPRP
jgi:hypothetical protein